MRKSRKKKPMDRMLVAKEARAAAIAKAIPWWNFTASMVAELIQTAARVRKEVMRPDSPLEDAIDEEHLWEFIDAMEEAAMRFQTCHPMPPATVTVPDPCR